MGDFSEGKRSRLTHATALEQCGRELTAQHALRCSVTATRYAIQDTDCLRNENITCNRVHFNIFNSVRTLFASGRTIGKFCELFDVRTWTVWCKMTLDRVDSFVGKIQPAASVSCLSQCQNIFGKRLKRWGSTGSWVSNCSINLTVVFRGSRIKRIARNCFRSIYE